MRLGGIGKIADDFQTSWVCWDICVCPFASWQGIEQDRDITEAQEDALLPGTKTSPKLRRMLLCQEQTLLSSYWVRAHTC